MHNDNSFLLEKVEEISLDLQFFIIVIFWIPKLCQIAKKKSTEQKRLYKIKSQVTVIKAK